MLIELEAEMENRDDDRDQDILPEQSSDCLDLLTQDTNTNDLLLTIDEYLILGSSEQMLNHIVSDDSNIRL